MAKKVFLNIFYTLTLVILVLCLVWSIDHKQYAVTLGALFAAALIVYLKLRLFKEMREMSRRRR